MHRPFAVILAALLGAPAAFSQPVEIAPAVYLLRGSFVPGTQPDGNSVLFTTKEGVVVVDTGRHEAHTRALLDFASAKKKAIRAVVNTHWHLDHVGGNALLRREVEGLKVYATAAIHEARKGFLANSAAQLEKMIAGTAEGSEERRGYETDLALIRAGEQLVPDEVVSRSGRLAIASRKLDAHVETHAVTGADLWLLDPASGVLVAGDLVTLPFPFLDTACPSRWSESLDRLARADFKLLVPGHGAPMSRAAFERYRSAFHNFLACGASERSKEQCADGWIADAGPLLEGEDLRFVRAGIHYYVDNHLRAPAEKNAKLCGTAH